MYPVLVADNDTWTRDALFKMGADGNRDFKVIGEASTEQEAWNMIHEALPMILITNIGLPQLDGMSLIHNIYREKLPIATVIVSEKAEFEYARKAISYGVSEYLLKPTEFTDFENALVKAKNRATDFRKMRNHMIRIQEFVDLLHEMDSLLNKKKLRDLLRSIFAVKDLHVKKNILRVFEGKLKGLLGDIGVEPSWHLTYDVNNHRSVVRYFQALIDEWIINSMVHLNNDNMFVIKQACQFIHNHFKDDITLDMMAKRCRMSVSHFSMLFKKQTGQSLIHYIHQVRVDEAKRLLYKTEHKVYKIGEMVGFSSAPYFTRTFKRITGVSPNEYRKILGL